MNRVVTFPVNECPGTSSFEDTNNISSGPSATGPYDENSSSTASKQDEEEQPFPSGQEIHFSLRAPGYKLPVGALVVIEYTEEESRRTPFPGKRLAHIAYAGLSTDVGLARGGAEAIRTVVFELLKTYDYLSYTSRTWPDRSPSRNGWGREARRQGLHTISDEEAWGLYRPDSPLLPRPARYWLSFPECFHLGGNDHDGRKT